MSVLYTGQNKVNVNKITQIEVPPTQRWISGLDYCYNGLPQMDFMDIEILKINYLWTGLLVQRTNSYGLHGY